MGQEATKFESVSGVYEDLPAAHIDDEPISLFGEWYRTAVEAGLYLPEAMTLATCTPDGKPRARIVLLKRFDQRGFVFFTNFDSCKGIELSAKPHAALLLHWHILQRQVRIEGRVEKLSDQDSFAYFRTRPRGSRIGAWASLQSQPLDSRQELERRVAQHTMEFENKEIPLPPFWGGFLVVPECIEFWQGRMDRLHERVVFARKNEDSWTARMLYP